MFQRSALNLCLDVAETFLHLHSSWGVASGFGDCVGAGQGNELDFDFHQKVKFLHFNIPWARCCHLLQILLPSHLWSPPGIVLWVMTYIWVSKCAHLLWILLGSSTKLLFHPPHSWLHGREYEICKIGLGSRSWARMDIFCLLFM